MKIEKEIHNSNNNKASQRSYIPTKIIKRNSNICIDFLYVTINSLINLPCFRHALKPRTLRLSLRKGEET